MKPARNLRFIKNSPSISPSEKKKIFSLLDFFDLEDGFSHIPFFDNSSIYEDNIVVTLN